MFPIYNKLKVNGYSAARMPFLLRKSFSQQLKYFVVVNYDIYDKNMEKQSMI